MKTSFLSRVTFLSLMCLPFLFGCMPTEPGEAFTAGDDESPVPAANQPTSVPDDEPTIEKGSIITQSLELEEDSPPDEDTLLGPGETLNDDEAESHPAPPGEIDMTNWLQYENEQFGFQISYPDDFIVTKPAPEAQPPTPLLIVAFQDKTITQGASVNVELPRLRIQVFDKGTADSLESWLETHAPVSVKDGWYIEPYTTNHHQGLSVYSKELISPGWFVYIANSSYVYQLTPIGSDAEAMLQTFEVTQ